MVNATEDTLAVPATQARPAPRARPILNMLEPADVVPAAARPNNPIVNAGAEQAPGPARPAAAAPRQTPRQRQVLEDLQGIRDSIEKIDANTGLSTTDRQSQILQQRRLYKQKMAELTDTAAAALPPNLAKQVQLAKEARQLTDHLHMLGENPLLSPEERRSLLDRHIDALRSKQNQIQWLRSQPPETDVDAPEPITP
jgi:hypothetical protein